MGLNDSNVCQNKTPFSFLFTNLRFTQNLLNVYCDEYLCDQLYIYYPPILLWIEYEHH